MHRKFMVAFAFLLSFAVLVVWSQRMKGQEPASPAEKSAGQPLIPQAGAEAGKTEEKSVLAKVRPFTEDSKPFLADRHVSLGLECSNCHGDADPKKPVTTDQCLQCHGSFEDLSQKTVSLDPNPHSNHLVDTGNVDCNFCHHGHKANEVGCRKCHAGMALGRNIAPAATQMKQEGREAENQ